MKKYRCKESFEVQMYDDDGRMEDGKTVMIKAGTVFTDKGDAYVVGFRGDVHLEAPDYTWLEISRSVLDECFEEV